MPKETYKRDLLCQKRPIKEACSHMRALFVIAGESDLTYASLTYERVMSHI